MHLPVKPLAAIFVALCLIREIRNGYFQRIPAYLPSIDWRPFLGISLFTALAFGCLIPADAVLAGWVCGRQSSLARAISDYGGIMGKGANPWCFLGAVYTLALFLKRKRWLRASFGCLLSSAIASVATLLLKLVFLRARPVTGEGPLSFFNLEGWGRKANLFYSLPSGDVAVVAGAAAYLFYRVKNTALRALLMLLPVLTAFSRVYKSKHWPSDTAFAVGLALLAALFVVHYERFASPKKV